MKSFYTTFKGADADLRFVFLTGVTKISQVSMFSGFNQPTDISLSRDFESLCGITKEELVRYFSDSIAELAKAYNCDFSEMTNRLTQKYDGYHFSEKMADLFNPFSLLNAFYLKRLGGYWFKSGTPTYLIRLLSHSSENLNEIVGKFYGVPQFDDYKADVEKPLPMIYQSGYLTIKGYDQDTESFLLDIPNNEVREGLIANGYLKMK